MSVIITRPQPECSRWVADLQARGFDAVAMPLIEIEPQPFVWDASRHFDAFVFVSRSAVAGFMACVGASALKGARCMVTGLGTRAALMDHAVSAELIDAPHADSETFDSETLWRVVGQRDWLGKRLCMVRGSDAVGQDQAHGHEHGHGLEVPNEQGQGRSWLSDRLRRAGAQVEFVVSYQRKLPPALVRAPQASDVWVFSSSQALAHLALLDKGTSWHGYAAIATHERIADAARALGFEPVRTCVPRLQALTTLLKRMKC